MGSLFAVGTVGGTLDHKFQKVGSPLFSGLFGIVTIPSQALAGKGKMGLCLRGDYIMGLDRPVSANLSMHLVA